jgi:hypothetical protein
MVGGKSIQLWKQTQKRTLAEKGLSILGRSDDFEQLTGRPLG